jgi:pimeloyl-ACP methyl ester carboxylesterase
MFSSGSGPPLLFLHGAGGNPGWQPYLDNLAQTHTVYAPSQAGFDGTPRPPWISTITDLAHFNQSMVRELGLRDYVLVGFSMGGWVAAEMAAMDHHNLKGLVLVDAAGIKPVHGEIAEIFMVSAQTRMNQRFYDISQVPNGEEYQREPTAEEQLVAHSNQEMASRLCWRPYLHNPSLPFYLGRVDTPTLLVWGRQDAIIPVECGEMFQAALSNARLQVIENCGHSPALEKPGEFVAAVNGFLAGL